MRSLHSFLRFIGGSYDKLTAYAVSEASRLEDVLTFELNQAHFQLNGCV